MFERWHSRAPGNRERTHGVDVDREAFFEETKRGSLEAVVVSAAGVKKDRESPSESSKETRRDEARDEWRELLACESWLVETSAGKGQRPTAEASRVWKQTRRLVQEPTPRKAPSAPGPLSESL